MTRLPSFPRRRAAGLATVEFALLAPILVVLFLSLVDIARGIQANMILINLSREAANLTVRGKLPLSDNNQAIIGQVAASAPPLDMNQRGMIYITRIIGSGTGSASRSLVLEQYRWDDSKNNRGFRVSGYAPASRVWTCGNWASGTAGTCSVPSGSNAPAVSLMSGSLADGEEIYVVESFYKFDMFFGIFKWGTASTSTVGPNLYSMTVF
ncbi:TadE/TadG family type IV pilus assembly protein [Duganella aceris]|uniref:Pilus assembly protein n=1 Tax=Duganella aceris TaxID=2703883 RepID=A0ABX0FPE1_9BURK|nr:TadE/TadG family type IV pilus assembly protein [Duganella aceris]NGZ86493.1 pilus assembly protein [Duganella aceris]